MCSYESPIPTEIWFEFSRTLFIIHNHYLFHRRQEQDKELKMYREIYSRHKDFLSACVGHEFELVSTLNLTAVVLIYETI